MITRIPGVSKVHGVLAVPELGTVYASATGTNEVVGYDTAQDRPREVQRYPTVQNPYSVGVDSVSGRLFVAGVTDGVVQIIDTT